MPKLKLILFLICISTMILILNGCEILGSSDNCRELQSKAVVINDVEYFRYNTKITIEFVDEWSHQDGEDYLYELSYPFEEIWDRTFVVETGCGQRADHYYTNYGTDEVISLGDSSFVKYINPVFYFHPDDSDYRLRGYVGIQFDRELEFERIQEIASAHNLKFREYDPGAPLGRYWLIVPKQACCNPIGIAEILIEYEEVLFAEPAFNFTVPPPDD